MKTLAFDLLLWLCASPLLLVEHSIRVFQRARYWKLAYTAAVSCKNCSADISLVGIWQCGCHYTYRGHILRVCPICYTLPRVVRCYECGLTAKLPERCD